MKIVQEHELEYYLKRSIHHGVLFLFREINSFCELWCLRIASSNALPDFSETAK